MASQPPAMEMASAQLDPGEQKLNPSGPGGVRVLGATVMNEAGDKENLLWREERRERRQQAKQERMNERQRRYGLVLCVVSAFDIIISGFMMVVAFAHAYLDNGVSLYCLGIQAFSHMLSSSLLALRFWDEYWQPEDAPAGPEHGLLKDRRRVYLVREKAMSFAMGGVMLLSAMALLTKAVRKMAYWDVWYKDHVAIDREAKFATLFLAWYGVVVYSFHVFVRGMVGSVLRRHVVWEALACSLVSMGYLLVMGVTAAFENEHSWKAEPIAAMVLALASVFEAWRMIRSHSGDVEAKLDIDPWA